MGICRCSTASVNHRTGCSDLAALACACVAKRYLSACRVAGDHPLLVSCACTPQKHMSSPAKTSKLVLDSQRNQVCLRLVNDSILRGLYGLCRMPANLAWRFRLRHRWQHSRPIVTNWPVLRQVLCFAFAARVLTVVCKTKSHRVDQNALVNLVN